MSKVFVDTSGWVAVLVRSDHHHQSAVDIYLERLSGGCDLVTHEGVLMEVGNALAGAKTRATVTKLLDTISRSARIELVHFTPTFLDAGWSLFSERMDKDWGIVDCLSFVVMKDLGISEALTADRHFSQAGFVKLLNYEQ